MQPADAQVSPHTPKCKIHCRRASECPWLCVHSLVSPITWLLSSPVQLTAGKRRKTGLLLEQRSCSAPPRRATLPPSMASRTTSLRSLPQTATEYPTDTDRENLSVLKRQFFLYGLTSGKNLLLLFQCFFCLFLFAESTKWSFQDRNASGILSTEHCWIIYEHLFIYKYIYILTFKAMSNCQCFLTSELGLRAKQKMFLECFFPPHWSRRSINVMNKKKKNTGDIWTTETFKGMNETVRWGDDWMSLQTNTWATGRVFFNQKWLWRWRSLFFCSNSGLNLCENEGTDGRTATGYWKCFKMKKPIDITH